MTEKDFRQKIEEHRQRIEIEDAKTRLSRTERRRKKKKKSKETPLLTTLTVILIGIPLAILIYVWGFWEPDQEEVAVDKDENVVEIQRNNEVSAKTNENDEDLEEKETSSETAKKDGKSDDEEKPSAKEKKNNQSNQEEKASTSKINHNASEKQTSSQTIHTVSANETLFRIAKRYYSDPISGVEKIKRANHLSSDVISPGQSLVIPE
ncbi:LysM peptidoglycan-binding domain-containing protein [Ureibacillus thermophilus]|uniref:LysM peptidoglycan-binding domain-containing protein n=1 Tax=Ureibacillus thermophilus TaxID=367743 RepID=A0A4P6UUG9_9BACL|nr:LysM peptidoglycan-binding domain-containing protein [Ureibacillus thermophilus]QBK25831.1 LysM peptidoglycan-binding domain-containing protein [Ureibacillus thermophilus]